MSEIKDKLVTAENLKNAYDDNKNKINELKGKIVSEKQLSINVSNLDTGYSVVITRQILKNI